MRLNSVKNANTIAMKHQRKRSERSPPDGFKRRNHWKQGDATIRIWTSSVPQCEAPRMRLGQWIVDKPRQKIRDSHTRVGLVVNCIDQNARQERSWIEAFPIAVLPM